jgi:hypothetical protein
MTAGATPTFYYTEDRNCWFQVRPWTFIQGALSSVLSQIYVWILVFSSQNSYIYHTWNFVTVKNKVQHVPPKWQCLLARSWSNVQWCLSVNILHIQYTDFVQNYTNQKLKLYKTFDHLNRKLCKTVSVVMCIALSEPYILTHLLVLKAI